MIKRAHLRSLLRVIRVWLCAICRSSLSLNCLTRILSKLLSLPLFTSFVYSLWMDCRWSFRELFLGSVLLLMEDSVRVSPCLEESILSDLFVCVYEVECLVLFPFFLLRGMYREGEMLPANNCSISVALTCMKSSSVREINIFWVTAPICLTFWNTPPKK